jgi:predicted amidohydrolase
MGNMPEPLPIELLPFTAGADPQANAGRVRAGIVAAASRGARVLLTPECCLPGYPSAARADLAGVDWCLIADLEDELMLTAERHGLLLVLGSAAPASDGCANDALLGGAVAPRRYRKQCLTPTDRRHFAPGTATVTVDHAGWRLGVAICYDLRFVDVFLRLAEAGADAFLVIAHMAGPDPDPGTKAALIPQLCATRAAELATPLAFCNTAADDRYCDSGVWDARGMRVAGKGDGALGATLVTREAFDPWYAGLRREALARWTATRR